MPSLRNACTEVLLALLLVVLNGWFVVRVVGMPYGPFQWVVLAATYLQENQFPGGCRDGVDNDADNLVDCVDPDCRVDAACGVPAPTMTLPGVALTVVVLLVVFAFGLRQRPQGAHGNKRR